MLGERRRTCFSKLINIPRRLRSCGVLEVVLFLLLLSANGIWQMALLDAIPTDDVPTNCRVETTVTSGTFDQYYALADIGNRPSERHLVNVSVEVAVRSRQEELAVLLSSLDRSHQYPDFAHTYEMRLTNVYTVLYRETLKLRAYHSPHDKLFPADRFRLRFLIGHDGNLTVLANDDPARVLLAVVDTKPPLDPHYISFASRMNAYPIQFSLGCGLPKLASEATTDDPAVFSTTQAPELSTPPVGVNTACPVCPECAKQRCQVVVRACADNAKDVNDRSRDEQEQRYYFYFNLLLQKNKTKQAIEPSSGRIAKP